jgi:hypothetical protein
MRGRDRKARRRRLFWHWLRQRMQDSADTTRFFGGGAMSLTVAAEGTGATVSDPGSREHTHRPIVFGASLLWRERGPLPTPQRAVRLRKKVLPSQAPSSRCTRPLRVRDQMVLSGKGPGMARIQCEGGENSVRRIEVGCHCWLSSWRRFHIHCARICQVSWPEVV